MPRACTICVNPQRPDIDAALVAGTSYRNIAKRFGTSLAAIFRHKSHAGQAIVKAAERRDERLGDNLLTEIGRVQDKLWSVLGKIETEGDHRGSVVALREIRESLETIDRMTTREAGGAGELAGINEIAERISEGLKRLRQARGASDGNGRSNDSRRVPGI